jgi:predicted nucleic acid-binding protein
LSQLVLDASVTLCWLFEEQRSQYTESLLHRLGRGDAAVACAIWPFEIANALAIAERQKRINASKIVEFMEILEELPITADRLGIGHALARTLELARRYRLTAYDAGYLELAMREALPIATMDQALRAAARAAGVELVS